jgi:transposase
VKVKIQQCLIVNAPRGKRVYDHAPAGHWRVTTRIGSIRLNGTTACIIIPAATDISIFRTYVQPIWISTLQPGKLVIYDNLSSHQDPETPRLIEQARAGVRSLPAYSPNLNSIEKMRRKVKALLRSAKVPPPAALNRAIARALAAVNRRRCPRLVCRLRPWY